MKIYLAHWKEYYAKEQIAGFTSKSAAKEWIAELTEESLKHFGGNNRTSHRIQEWDISQDNFREFVPLYG